MTYATVADLIDKFGESEMIELTNFDDPDGVVVDSVQCDRVLQDADSLINSYIQARNKLPLLTVPRSLVLCACDLARFELDRNRTREDVTIRYERWIAWLKDVAKGLVNLGLDTNNQPVGEVPDLVRFRSNDRVFTDDFFARRDAAGGLWRQGYWQ